MSNLTIILIDVGWGDSILLEYENPPNPPKFALVDCNDTSNLRSSYIFVKRYLERRLFDINNGDRVFDFVLLTHGHADHASGIQKMMSEFRTDWFWYPKSVDYGAFAKVIQYANKYPSKVNRHQAIDNTKVLPDFGDVELKILWPPYIPNGIYSTSNENNNSVVLALTLNQVSFLLTGDCEADNWAHIIPELGGVSGLAVFQVPHHGAVNGMFTNTGSTPWLSNITSATKLAISSHIKPYNHPAQSVINVISNQNFQSFRTDQHYHISFNTDGTLGPNDEPNLSIKWSHI